MAVHIQLVAVPILTNVSIQKARAVMEMNFPNLGNLFHNKQYQDTTTILKFCAHMVNK